MENNIIGDLVIIDSNEIIDFIYNHNLQFTNCVLDKDFSMLDIYFANDNDLTEIEIENVFCNFVSEFKDKYKAIIHDLEINEYSCIIVLDNNYKYALNND